MSKWTAELQEIGRGKVSRSVDFEAETLEDAEIRAVKECGKHLMSRDIGLADKCDLTYTVLAGFHGVGIVKIFSAD